MSVRVYDFRKVRTPLTICVLFACSCLRLPAQTLDQRAYDAVWDRLEKMSINTATEQVHVLQYVTPATWGDGSDEGLRELQRIAGAIPSDSFKIDPSVRTKLLHDVYASFVADLSLPKVSPEQERSFLAASKRYGAAVDAAEDRLAQFEGLWKIEEADLKSRNEQITSLKKQRFRDSKVGYFDDVEAEVDAAEIEVQKFRPVAGAWVKAVERLTSALNASMRGSNAGIWTYEASYSGLQGNGYREPTDQGGQN